MTETKVCKKCGVEKPVSDFGKGAKLPHGPNGSLKQYYRSICKQCTNTGPQPRKDNIDPKKCTKCGTIKPLSEYEFEPYRQRYRADCKECKNKRIKNYLSNHPEIREKINKNRKYKYANEPGYAERIKEKSKLPEVAKRRRELYALNPEPEKRRNKKRRDERKKFLLEHLGNVCSNPNCNETKNLQFDHINPLEKSFSPSWNLHKSLDELIKETDKCQLLCPKCHLEKTKNEWLSGVLYHGLSKERLDTT